MKGFALLWAKTLDSSVWRRESKDTRLVWVTLLMMKDAEGIVQASKVGLADRARVTDAECEEALRVLLSPDQNDTSGVEEGRRIREVPGGWHIINHDMYRFSTEAKREFWRTVKAEQREKKKRNPRKARKSAAQVRAENDSREKRSVKAFENGDLAEAERIAAEGLPEADGEYRAATMQEKG